MLDNPEKLKISSHNFLQLWMPYAFKIDKKNLKDVQIIAI
jgi:hypothetical protein